jgi:hypothetical protein
MKSRKMITRTLTITTLAVVMALAVVMTPITHAIMWVGLGGHVGSPTPPPRHGGPPINIPTMIYIPGGGGGGSGGSGTTSTFSTPSTSNNGQPQAVVTEYSNGVVTQSTPYGTIGHGGVHVPVRTTTSQSTTSTTSTPTVITKTITITKTYTQYIYDTYEVNHYIYYYLYPIIKWVFTLVNIGYEQAPGYHSVGSEKLFTPGSGSGGIFVPVFAQEAVYTYNIAPTTKPQITGWYTGGTSQSTSGPFLISQSSTPPQLTGVQQAVDNAGQVVSNIQQLATTNPNGLTSKTYVYYGNGGGTSGTSTSGTNSTSPSTTGTNRTTNSQPTTNPESWITFWKAGPGGVGGTTVTNYGPGGVTVTYKPPVFGSPPSLPPITLPPGLLPPGVNSPPGFHNKFIHNGALAGVPIIGSPPSIPISGLGNVLSGVSNAILNGVENGWNWLVNHI